MTSAATAAALAPKRYALYTRESTEKQLEGRAYDSHASQQDYLRAWVRDQGGVVETVYSDTFTGTQLDGRDGLLHLLGDAQDGKFDVAVAYDLDRWHRSMDVYVLLRKIQKETGIQFISATQRFDDTPEGRCMESQFSAFAEYLSALIGKKVKIKRTKMAEQGMWRGGLVPYGYSAVDKKLVPLEEEAKVVRLMFDLYLKHHSVAVIQHLFHAEGIKDRKGQPWINTSVEVILRNPTYVGRTLEAGKIYPANHPPIVDPAIYEAAQRVLPTKRRLKRTNDRPYPLLDILQCGCCGAAMTMSYVKKKNGYRVPYYRCTRSFNRGWKSCTIRIVNADQIERWVADLIADMVASPNTVTKAVEASNDSKDDRLKPLREREKELEGRLETIRTGLAQLVGVLKLQGAEAFASLKDELAQGERDKLFVEGELARQREEITQIRGAKADPERVQIALKDLRMLYEVATPEEKGELLRLLFKRITYNGPDQEIGVELFDRSGIELKKARTGQRFLAGSILSTAQLPVSVSNSAQPSP